MTLSQEKAFTPNCHIDTECILVPVAVMCGIVDLLSMFSRLVHVVDWYPTLVELAGGSVTSKMSP